MKVVYLGFPKTGTKTIAEALKLLGYNVFDFEEHFYYHGTEWKQIMKEESDIVQLFRKMYKNVDAAVDGLVYLYWKEFIEAFPDCKFLIHYRDPEEWFDSFENQIDIITSNIPFKVLSTISPTGIKYARHVRMLANIQHSTVGCTFPWQNFQGLNFNITKKRYIQHNLEIQQMFPKEKLHVVDFNNGWEDLCKFLNKEIPNESFPHKNKRGAVVKERLSKHPLYQQCKKEACIATSIIVLMFAFIIYRAFLRI